MLLGSAWRGGVGVGFDEVAVGGANGEDVVDDDVVGGACERGGVE